MPVSRDDVLAGARILAAAPALVPAGVLVRACREHWDGGGFPEGLAGERIPLGARIVAAAATCAVEGVGALRDGAGTRFDPAVVEAVLATGKARTLPVPA